MTKLTKSLCVGAAAAALLFCGPSRPAYASKPEARTDRGYSPEQTASYYYTEGIKNNIMNGDPQQSVDLFKKVLEIDSTHAPTLFELATLTMSEPETALRYSLRANAADTGNIWYRTQLGRLLIATQRYDSAMTVYNSLLKAAPNNPDNYRLIAMLYEQKGDPEKALIILDSAERQLGAVEMLAGYKRQLLLNMKQYDRALVEAKAMVENFPYDEDNYVELAELYTTLGQLAQAGNALLLRITHYDVPSFRVCSRKFGTAFRRQPCVLVGGEAAPRRFFPLAIHGAVPANFEAFGAAKMCAADTVFVRCLLAMFCQAFHHSTSCIQNSRRQISQPLPVGQCPRNVVSTRHGSKATLCVFVYIGAFGNCSRNTLCRVLSWCAADHSSTAATIRL